MRIVFLDIDGVLNTSKNYRAYHDASTADPDKDASIRMESKHVDHLFDLENIAHLNSITDAFEDVKIVVSSSWRRLYDGRNGGLPFGALCKLLQRRGVKATVIGKTPTWLSGQRFSERVQRGREIKEWLSINRHLGIDGYVVLDDDSDMDDVWAHFVRTAEHLGLTAEAVERAKEVLARNIRPVGMAEKLHKHPAEVRHDEEGRGALSGGGEAGQAGEEAGLEAAGGRTEAAGDGGARGHARKRP